MEPYEVHQRQMQIPALAEEQPQAPVYLEAGWLESSFAKKNQEVLVGNEFNMSQQCDFTTKKTNGFLGGIRKTISPERAGIA